MVSTLSQMIASGTFVNFLHEGKKSLSNGSTLAPASDFKHAAESA